MPSIWQARWTFNSMCGIAGVIPISKPKSCQKEYLAGMIKRIQHRGPDQAALVWKSWGGMGTARLCIIDSIGGRQPFSCPQAKKWLCFNGEVYNYTELKADLSNQGWNFRTNSDTEVVLASLWRWGKEAIDRMDGMFALAYYDEEKKQLFLARDRFGEKPLFVFQERNYFAFASEIKCFLELPEFSPDPDMDSLMTTFGHWTTLPDKTVFRGVEQLAPGEFLEVHNGKIRRGVYYRPPIGGPINKKISLQSAKNKVRASLEQSVKLRLRSDQKVGVYLSGGLDSSALAALIAKNLDGDLTSFGVSFANPAFDEGKFQRLMSTKLGIRHFTLRIQDGDIAKNFPAALWHAETPVFRTAFVPMYLLAKKVAQHGVRVVLTGEGSDEVFLGYDIFKEAYILEKWHSMPSGTRAQALRRLYPFQNHLDFRGRQALGSFFAENSTRIKTFEASHFQRFQNLKIAQGLLRKKNTGSSWNQWVRSQPRSLTRQSLVRRAQWIEMETLLAGYLLSTQGDRMAMAFGVENRCPFLSPALVALALQMPENFLLKSGWQEKYLLKKAFADVLPLEILSRPKKPYVAPDAQAILNKKPDYLDCLYSEHELKQSNLWDSESSRLFLERLKKKSPELISPRDSQAFLLMLSTALLFEKFKKEKKNPKYATVISSEKPLSGLWRIM